MFTGLVAEVGKVSRLDRGGNARLEVAAGALADGLRIGDSVAVNGACLTVTAVSGGALTFDVVAETLQRTNLGDLHPGDPVNLERPLKAGDEFGGHFVLGHVDAVGRIVRLDREELEISAGDDIMRYVVEKGSITVDGISLTVARLGKSTFTMALIPHTREATNLAYRRAGDRVNLEADILGKYVERFIRRDSSGGISEKLLKEAGF